MKMTLESIRKNVPIDIYKKAFELSNFIDSSLITNEYIKKFDCIKFKYDFFDDNSNKVFIMIDEDNEVVMSNCTCDKFHDNSYCVHSIALALSIIFHHLNDSFVIKKDNSSILNYIDDTISNFKSKSNLILIPIIYKKSDNNIYLTLDIIIENKRYKINDFKNFLHTLKNYSKITISKYQFNNFIDNYELQSRALINMLLKISTLNIFKDEILIEEIFLDELFFIYKGSKIIVLENNNERFINVLLDDGNLVVKLKNFTIKFDYYDILFLGKENIYYIENNNLIKIGFLNDQIKRILYETIYKEKYINIKNNMDVFLNNIYSYLKKYIEIDQQFLKKYEIKKLKINSYLNYINKKVFLKYDLIVDGNKVDQIIEVYLNQIYENYKKTLYELGFVLINDSFLLNNTNKIGLLIKGDYNILENFGEVYLSDSINKIKIKNKFDYKINIKYNNGLLNLETKYNFTDEQIKKIIENYNANNKYVFLNDDTIFDIDNNFKTYVKTLKDFNLDYTRVNKKEEKPLYEILKINSQNLKYFNIDDKLKKILNEISDYKKLNFELPSKLKNVLRNYQIEAFNWLKVLTKYNFSGILADEMGLGKSLEIISLILSDEIIKPTLIVVPASLIYNWKNEFNKWDESIVVTPIIGNKEEREKIIYNIKSDEKVVYITSYDLLKRDVFVYNKIFRFLIIDEAQFIKNEHAKKSKAVKKISSEIRFSLTGTPIENSISDLFSIFDFLMPGYLVKEDVFQNNNYLENNFDEKKYLITKISPFILRRTKKDCLNDLPLKLEETYYCKLEKDQRMIYDAFLLKTQKEFENNYNRINVLSNILRLRQICVHPKLVFSNYTNDSSKIELAFTLILKAINEGHKIVVFSQFTSAFRFLKEKFNDNMISFFELTGKTKPEERIKMVDNFNNQDNIKVFLVSLKAGGFGLNLVGADVAIHLDPWWNLALENQASDRIHRIGQMKKVQIIKLIASDTIEEKVIELQNNKKALFDFIIKNENTQKKLTDDDIKYILS